jgi:uncharacterized protein
MKDSNFYVVSKMNDMTERDSHREIAEEHKEDVLEAMQNIEGAITDEDIRQWLSKRDIHMDLMEIGIALHILTSEGRVQIF